ncbi:hypothetical protein BDB00DRAFT_858186 [Zychaea mexicana]|uniref:uncharacterized protein n=1 Tax=Zychaea mexicana TaxID=64656 RepID=UPI0022FE8225|nr:uncharacterized protein BDB00DRAFT_858186 [Zychaea mexicana]KAI9479604.1 hypothetical protein BDB00DRAFT_858186 [Zychaea mexicana]
MINYIIIQVIKSNTSSFIKAPSSKSFPRNFIFISYMYIEITTTEWPCDRLDI